MTDGDHCVHAVSTEATDGARQNGCVPRQLFAQLNATRFDCFLPFAVSLHFLPRRRAQSLSDARLSNPCRFAAMIAIECISNSTLAACLAPFCREIILAAFLIMCNAAEIFFR